MSTTIKVSKKTKDLLTKVLIKLESELGRRLDYDEVIRILIDRVRIRNPEYLRKLMRMSVPEEVVRKAHELLKEEARLEEGVFKRRYGSRHECSS